MALMETCWFWPFHLDYCSRLLISLPSLHISPTSIYLPHSCQKDFPKGIDLTLLLAGSIKFSGSLLLLGSNRNLSD